MRDKNNLPNGVLTTNEHLVMWYHRSQAIATLVVCVIIVRKSAQAKNGEK